MPGTANPIRNGRDQHMEMENRKIDGTVDRFKLQHKKNEKPENKAVQVEFNATALLAGTHTRALLT